MSKSQDKRLAIQREIKRFHVRDGYVLDEHPDGSVVRYDKHAQLVRELREEIMALKVQLASLVGTL